MERLGMPDLIRGRRRDAPVALFLVLGVAALGLSGCGVVKAIEHHVENKVVNSLDGPQQGDERLYDEDQHESQHAL